MGPAFLSFLILYLTSASLAPAAGAPRASPYDDVLNGFLDSDGASNSPPRTASYDRNGVLDSDGGSNSPSPSQSPQSRASLTPKAPPPSSTSSPTPKTASDQPKSPKEPSPSDDDNDSASESDDGSNSRSEGFFGKISSAVDATFSAIKHKATPAASDSASEGSLDSICGATPSPELCMSLVNDGELSGKTGFVDTRRVLRIVLEHLVDETRDIRDKSRALATSELEEDDLNTCNRSLGYCLRNTKEAIDKLDAGDDRSMKTNFDSYSNSIGNCKDKPIPVQDDARRLFKILLIANDMLVTLYPAISREVMFPEQYI